MNRFAVLTPNREFSNHAEKSKVSKVIVDRDYSFGSITAFSATLPAELKAFNVKRRFGSVFGTAFITNSYR